jgi:hypothetical protein
MMIIMIIIKIIINLVCPNACWEVRANHRVLLERYVQDIQVDR